MKNIDDEETLLRSVALRNAQVILAARQRAEQELLQAKTALEAKTDALDHSLAMLRATLEATTDAILVTSDTGDVIDFNKKYVEILKIPEVMLRQRKHGDLLAFIAARYPDAAAFRQRVDSIYALAPAESVDILHPSDGRTLERYSRIQFVDGRNVGRVWTFRDITEQRRVESALREEGRILELLNRTGIAISSHLNLERLIQEITDAATELSGARMGAFFYYATGEAGDAMLLFSLSGAPRSAFERFGNPRATALFGPTFHGAPPIRSDDILKDPRYGQSAPHWGMPSGHPPVRSYLAVPVVTRHGAVIGGLFFGHPEPGVFAERTERLMVGIASQAAVAIDNARLYEAAQKSAAERELLLISEQGARRVAEEQNNSKDAFLAMLGHELRNPLSAISAGLTVIQRAGPASDKAARAFDIIRRQNTHLVRMVDDLLDTARMLAGKIALEQKPVHLDEAIAACIAALETAGRTKAHRVTLSAQPVRLYADPVRLDQVATNLITNALKYTLPGGEIEVAVRHEGTQAVFSVADNGIGMSARLIQGVFEPFVQGERAIDRSEGGLGIGLTLVRKLVELHGGSVTATSAGEGLGSLFTVRLPIAAENC
ncbi:MAG: hypothetical protein JWR68_415 [Polaromonas sp.]|nr:hypothetical protein [Polaromonas sp.]